MCVAVVCVSMYAVYNSFWSIDKLLVEYGCWSVLVCRSITVLLLMLMLTNDTVHQHYSVHDYRGHDAQTNAEQIEL